MAFALVLPKLIAYLINYLCGCCDGVVLIASAVVVQMLSVVVVGGVGVVAEIILFVCFRIAQKRRTENAPFRI